MKPASSRHQSPPKPINISPELAAKCDGPDQFARFDTAFRAMMAVPKAEIDKREAKWKRSQARKRSKA
jgi:hypothetical protein